MQLIWIFLLNTLKTIVIDNYDSFTYNLVRYINISTGERPYVVRNDLVDIDIIDNFDNIVFSPGPGLPYEAGLMMDIIKKYYCSKKILGVCLGHQAIAEFFGARLKKLNSVKHGVSSNATIFDKSNIYKKIPTNISVGRYHSWCVDEDNFPHNLIITSKSEDNNIMSLKHNKLPIYGVQYHPESILTPYGLKIINNFLKLD